MGVVFHSSLSLFVFLLLQLSQDTEPQRVFDLPPGYESHLKLDVVDSYEATLEEKHIPEDSSE